MSRSPAQLRPHPRRPARRVIDSRCRPVECVETGQRFESHTLAADWLGCNHRRIRKAAEYGGAVYGFHFRRLDEPEGGQP